MANYTYGIDLPFSASGDLSSYQYFFVKVSDTAGYVNLATGGSAPGTVGVLQNAPKGGEAAQVRVIGDTKIRVTENGIIAVGDYIEAASDGGAQLLSGSCCEGIAVEAMATGSGYIRAVLRPMTSVLNDNTP
jgi:hypothetical protein